MTTIPDNAEHPAPPTGERVALRLAVAAALIDSERRGLNPLDPRAGNGQTHYEDDADAILAMPEMQAIRQFIASDRSTWCCTDCWFESVRHILPRSVIEWADPS